MNYPLLAFIAILTVVFFFMFMGIDRFLRLRRLNKRIDRGLAIIGHTTSYDTSNVMGTESPGRWSDESMLHGLAAHLQQTTGAPAGTFVVRDLRKKQGGMGILSFLVWLWAIAMIGGVLFIVASFGGFVYLIDHLPK